MVSTKQTALHTAVEIGSYETALLLLKNGADVTIKSDSGTPLEIATKTGDARLIALLESGNSTGSTYTAFQGANIQPFKREG